MQHGQRTQHPAPKKSHRQRTPARLAREPNTLHTNGLTAATKSAARLAAEAAFALPPADPLPQQAAQVSVRRSRAAGLAVAPVAESQLESNTQQRPKNSRVFRVEAEPTPHPIAANWAGSTSTTEARTHNDILAAQTLEQASLRRIASDKRPGPVTHVVHAVPDLQAERQPDDETLRPPLGVLIAELRGVTPDLELIERAQAFSLVDERVVREWLRLSRQLDELHEKILAQVQ